MLYSLQTVGGHTVLSLKKYSTNPVAYDQSFQLSLAGLMQKHQVQNGLLLCKVCHLEFDTFETLRLSGWRQVDLEGREGRKFN